MSDLEFVTNSFFMQSSAKLKWPYICFLMEKKYSTEVNKKEDNKTRIDWEEFFIRRNQLHRSDVNGFVFFFFYLKFYFVTHFSLSLFLPSSYIPNVSNWVFYIIHWNHSYEPKLSLNYTHLLFCRLSAALIKWEWQKWLCLISTSIWNVFHYIFIIEIYIQYNSGAPEMSSIIHNWSKWTSIRRRAHFHPFIHSELFGQ